MYLVVFKNRKRPEIDQEAYARDVAHMCAMAAEQPGYLSFKNYIAEDGEHVSISEWTSEAYAKEWGANELHRTVQARGREEYYSEYTLYGCNKPMIHHCDTDHQT